MRTLFSCIFLLLSTLVNAQNWETDFEQAKTLAVEKQVNIIVVFQGSDWCAPCRKLDKNIWSSEEFKTYAAENAVLLKVDFPKRKKNRLSKEQQEKNGLMAERYNPKGYLPQVVVLNPQGKVLGRTGYNKYSPSEYISLLSSFK